MGNYDTKVFYKDKKGRIKYNKLCMSCPYKCKQSWRAEIRVCRRTEEEKAKKRKEEIKYETISKS